MAPPEPIDADPDRRENTSMMVVFKLFHNIDNAIQNHEKQSGVMADHKKSMSAYRSSTD
jgi:hypothetical protein